MIGVTLLMVVVDDVHHMTIGEASKQFGVSSKTVREWIRKKIIDEPPQAEHGVNTVSYFPPEYMVLATAKIKEYRKEKNARRQKGNGA